MHRPAESDREPLAQTPALERLLARLSRKLSAQIWMHGLGTVLAALGAWLVFAFFADWALHVPLGVRWFHLLVFLALPVVLLWRELVRHLRRRPGRGGLALLVERVHPDLNELFVTAVELQTRPRREAAPELVDNVLRDADRRAAALDLARVLEEKPQRLRLAAGLSLATAVVAASLLQREHAAIFYARLFGGDVPWPQRTHLSLEVAANLEHARVSEVEGGFEARVARGTDVPIVVRASGVAPEEVTLHFTGDGAALAHEVVLGGGSDGTYRTLLRSVQEDALVHVTGGDDDDGEPKLRLIVLDPPDVASLAVAIEPPAYTGHPPRVEIDRDVQVLAGTKLSVTIVPTPAEARGIVRLLPSNETVELAPMPFGARDPSGASPEPAALGFELVAEQSLRYRFELVDATGLSNPDPGLFSIDVVGDERPSLELVAPGRADLETVAGGAVRLSARARDDFGIASLAWRSRAQSASGETSSEWVDLAFEPAPPPVRGDEAARGVTVAATTRLDVGSLSPSGAATEGDLFELDLRALDNRPPAADGTPDPRGVGSCPPVRLRVVTSDEFLRRLQDRLNRVRGQVASLEELQRQRIARTRETLAAIEGDAASASSGDLASLLVGQRRVQGDADALTREFAGALESVLYARIDEKSEGLLAELDDALSRSTTRGFPIEAWKSLAESVRGGRQKPQGLSGQLAGLFDVSLSISADEVPLAVESLDRAAAKVELGDVHAELTSALQHQETAHRHLIDLLDRLAEWDNFQSILSLTRDILERQKSVRDRMVEQTGPGASQPSTDRR